MFLDFETEIFGSQLLRPRNSGRVGCKMTNAHLFE